MTSELFLVIGEVRSDDRLEVARPASSRAVPVQAHECTLKEFCASFCISAVLPEEPLKSISQTFSCRLHLFSDGLYQESIVRSGQPITPRQLS